MGSPTLIKANRCTAIAYIYVANQMFDKSEEYFLKAFKLDPQRSIDIILLAQHYEKIGQPNNKIRLLKEALKTHPEDTSILKEMQK